MNQIEQIKRELAEISPWPWHSDINRVMSLQKRNFIAHCFDNGNRGDMYFIAQSPERIAALVELVEASDALVCPQDNHTLGCGCECVVCERRQTAHRKLGLE